ncbi:uncharacterized protein LOC143240829 isoform X2 [Tachypleus tridentatus]|uniref:uncharacterized protein LOC143240829 isoform X2 n=1 Tax=Tachypleus tridentatus TaxID=6853 RepID=UPI003FD607FA
MHEKKVEYFYEDGLDYDQNLGDVDSSIPLDSLEVSSCQELEDSSAQYLSAKKETSFYTEPNCSVIIMDTTSVDENFLESSLENEQEEGLGFERETYDLVQAEPDHLGSHNDQDVKRRSDSSENSDHDVEKRSVSSENSDHDVEKRSVSSENSDHDVEKRSVSSENSDHDVEKRSVSLENSDHDVEKRSVSSENSDHDVEKRSVSSENSDHDVEKRSVSSENSDHDVEKRSVSSENSDHDVEKRSVSSENSDHDVEKRSVSSENSDHDVEKRSVSSENSDHDVEKRSVSSEKSLEMGEANMEDQYRGNITELLHRRGAEVARTEKFAEDDQEKSEPMTEEEETLMSVSKLKSSYIQQAQENSVSPTRDLVTTGISVKTLSTSFTSEQDDTTRDLEVIDTGISKSSLAEQPEGCGEKEPLEDIKPSIDRAKATLTFSQFVPLNQEEGDSQSEEQEVSCKVCGKHVYLMDKIMAVKSAFHKSCFRCKECGKSLNMDTYFSHMGEIYCKLHHKHLLQPKIYNGERLKDDNKTEEITAVEDLDNIRLRFESPLEECYPLTKENTISLTRTESIQARMAKYQSAVSKVHQNGEHFISSEDDDNLTKLKNDENKELSDLRETIGARSSETMRAAYERACKEANTASPTRGQSISFGKEVKAVNIKQKFENGDLDQENNEKMERARREKEEDLSIVNETRDSVAGARTLFKQFDSVATTTSLLPGRPSHEHSHKLMYGTSTTPTSGEVVKGSEPGVKEQADVVPVELQERFNYFENYKESKPQLKCDDEVPRDPKVVRASDVQEEVMITDTTKRMLDKFKQLENQGAGTPVQNAPNPMKKITPPRDYIHVIEKHEPSPEPQHDPDVIRCTYKVEDDMTWKADQARNLKAKFEHWDVEVERENKIPDDEGLPEMDITKNLRAKFEAIRAKSTETVEKPQLRGRKFVELGIMSHEECDFCAKKLYPMERMEASGFKFHKNCFRCCHCNSMLRLDNYTINSHKFYCTPHFKQFFKSKGSYEDGFIKKPSENCYTNGDAPDVTRNQEVAA